MNIPWLTLVIVIPVGAAILLQIVPRGQTAAIKGFTVAIAAAVAVIVGALLWNMSSAPASGARVPGGPGPGAQAAGGRDPAVGGSKWSEGDADGRRHRSMRLSGKPSLRPHRNRATRLGNELLLWRKQSVTAFPV